MEQSQNNNLQYLFDFVVNHLREQGCKALKQIDGGDFSSTCMYRGENGTKCAVGALIKDELYDKRCEEFSFSEFEGFPLSALPLDSIPEDYPNWTTEERYIFIINAIQKGHNITLTDKDVELLSNLQTIHDKCIVEEWEKEFQRIAETLNTNYKAP